MDLGQYTALDKNVTWSVMQDQKPQNPLEPETFQLLLERAQLLSHLNTFYVLQCVIYENQKRPVT